MYVRVDGRPIGRNEPCPCGSGKKFKNCHLNGDPTVTTTKFIDVVKQDTPRLVVTFGHEGGHERFQWGIIGAMPILSLIGCVVRVQAELPLLEPSDDRYDCPESALVIVWDGARFHWFVHRDIPADSLVGMLETIKLSIIGSNLAQQQAAQGVGLVGPDGRPLMRRM